MICRQGPALAHVNPESLLFEAIGTGAISASIRGGGSGEVTVAEPLLAELEGKDA